MLLIKRSKDIAGQVLVNALLAQGGGDVVRRRSSSDEACGFHRGICAVIDQAAVNKPCHDIRDARTDHRFRFFDITAISANTPLKNLTDLMRSGRVTGQIGQCGGPQGSLTQWVIMVQRNSLLVRRGSVAYVLPGIRTAPIDPMSRPVPTTAETTPLAPIAGPRLRSYGAVNGRGLWTLYLKEVRRFLKVFQQTIAAPVVTTLLFFAIFTLALGRSVEMVDGIGFSAFLAPGLVMMAMVQNAFANTSSTLVIGKIQGNIVDVLMPPLAPWELTAGFALGGISRGLVVGAVTVVVIALFAPVAIHDLFAVIYFAIAACTMMALLGILGGIWSEKFDHIAAVTNFVVTPLTFLSGTFYSIERLPEIWRTVAYFNPFFYMIDGFRYGFIGHSDAPLWLGVAVLLVVDLALLTLTWWLFRIGYKLKT